MIYKMIPELASHFFTLISSGVYRLYYDFNKKSQGKNESKIKILQEEMNVNSEINAQKIKREHILRQKSKDDIVKIAKQKGFLK